MAQAETVTNIDDAAPLIYSPLNGAISRNGRSVEVEIYRAENEEWILEVVDEHGNSTVWNDLFPTDQAALDEALRTIDELGIDTVIGPPPGQDKRSATMRGLSDAELYELGDFLAEPVFDEPSHAKHVLSLLMRHYNAVVEAFNTDPGSFEPLFMRGAEYGAAEWSNGFLCGFQFDERAWNLLAVGQPAWFAPFMRLGTEYGIAITHKQGDAARWVDAVVPSLSEIAAYWQARRSMPGDMLAPATPIVRATPKVGRKDPCPCGSGKKMKKCCGATPMAPAPLH